MQLSLTTKSKSDKKSSGETTSFSSCRSPEDKTGAPAGLPLFLQRLTQTAVAPPMLQRQPIDDEEEELIQPKPAGAAIRLRSLNEPQLPARQPLKEATLQRQMEPEEEEEELLQAKLTVGDPNDVYEQEADLVAEQVMRTPEPDIPRKPT